MSFPWLTLLGLLPMLGAAVLMMIKGAHAKAVGMVFSIATLILGVAIAVLSGMGMRFAEQLPWIKAFGAYWALGPVDGISLTMVLLTVILTPIVMLASWDTVDADDRWTSHVFFALVLALESLSLFVFLATDVLLFYLFFEATLIPMYFLLGGFGQARRGYAAIKFLLFGLAGGLVMLASVIGLSAISSEQRGAPTYLLSELTQLDLGGNVGRWLFLGFFIAFALKAPMVPFHTWLPDAAEQGTPGGSTLMVGILDKIGTFGMIRFCLELFPEASKWASPVIIALALISIIYGALAAVGQKDLYRLIAFTSISHFGFIVLGIFSFTTVSMSGATFYMFNHAFSTAVLFLVAGYLVRRRGSQQISAFGGVQKVAPVLAGLFLMGGLSSAALPGMSSFVSEFMVIAGSFARHPIVAGVSTVAMVLSALYILLTYQRMMTGPVTHQVAQSFDAEGRSDLDGREKLAIAPLLLIILAFGLFPKPMLDTIQPAVQNTMQIIGEADPAAPLAKGQN
ncbi:NADH-quinone oxidoreductase subunit M [Enemella evansiae]|uniref:NADH-quinone oxidoreductase subunit M n=1 Tax=Enemella evansiae TaxID=2016499 RepID=UPI000B96C57F|nr:NADH-quinone oxidoreductase subunit M [Enemella evansiae]OYO09299.1 NADH-quinone oxidoreductase subunit M [Enemella evansiae]